MTAEDGGVQRRMRHTGGGLLALFDGDEQAREIGVTPGWDFRDRDEVITRYNDYAALQAELDAVRGKLGLRDFAYDQLRERLCHCEAALEERDAQLTASRKEHAALVAGVEGLCVKWTESHNDPEGYFADEAVHDFVAELRTLIAAGKGAA